MDKLPDRTTGLTELALSNHINGITFSLTEGESHFPLSLSPILSERHIGIDQGTRNFAIVAVDKSQSGLKLVAANLYDLHPDPHFDMLDLANALIKETDMLDWMQLSESQSLPTMDRVIAHLEQMDIRNM